MGKAEQTREAILRTCIKQLETTEVGRALVYGLLEPALTLKREALRALFESIANNLACYVTIPDLCEVCGQVSAGNTCCPPEAVLEALITRGLTQDELMTAQGFVEDHSTCETPCGLVGCDPSANRERGTTGGSCRCARTPMLDLSRGSDGHDDDCPWRKGGKP